MIMLTDNLYIGGATDTIEIDQRRIGALLNVAQDLRSEVGWPTFEYMQVGLIDGPGNPDSTYIAAVLALVTLLKRHSVLVCCHEGGRSLAVCIMYMECYFTRGWNAWVELMSERAGIDLPVPNKVHKAAFDKMDWKILRKLAGEKP